MIHEFEFFHGAVFTRMLHGSKKELTIASFPSKDNGSYVLNKKVGIYIKYSAKRMSPWRFTFQEAHQEEILEMKNKIGNAFLLLVCNDDGIVTLSFEELKMILDDHHDPVEWICAARTKRKMYTVSGSDGELEFKIGQNDFPKKILDIL